MREELTEGPAGPREKDQLIHIRRIKTSWFLIKGPAGRQLKDQI